MLLAAIASLTLLSLTLQNVVWSDVSQAGMRAMRVGTAAQSILGLKGDGIKVDIG